MPGRRSARAKAAVNYAEDGLGDALLASVKDEEEEDEDEDVPKAKAGNKKRKAAAEKAVKSKSEPKKKKGKKNGEEEDDSEEKPRMKSVLKKGAAPVDEHCNKASSAHVLCDDDGVVWDCMLNQTNIAQNNNKYYLIQLLEGDGEGQYWVWMRWGRVGFNGQNSLTPCGNSVERAKGIFAKKFSDKTKNDWSDKANFVKVPGKYDLVHMDYEAGGDDEFDDGTKNGGKGKKSSKSKPEEEKKVEIKESKLHSKLQDLIRLIADVKRFEETVMEMEYDAKKAPLGKITKLQIKAGYAALKEISELIGEGKTTGSAILNACNDFYTRIPHEFGMSQPPKITTMDQVKRKISLLEALGDIEVAMKIINSREDTDMNPVDRHYKNLACDLEPLEKASHDYGLVERYIKTTHAKTHNMYTMEVMDIFEASKGMEKDRFSDKGNRMLLFHGSRLSNWTGILSQGLRIAPPEAPVTGYMFGKGIKIARVKFVHKTKLFSFPSRCLLCRHE